MGFAKFSKIVYFCVTRIKHCRFSFVFQANVTVPKPFSFAPKDAALRKSRLEREAAAVEESRRLANSFRAQPMPLLSSSSSASVSIPDPPPPTSPHSPLLETRYRAAKRASFDARVEAQKASVQHRLELIEKERVAEEAKQLAQERRARVFKAAPVRRYRLVLPSLPPTPVTKAKSFSFATEERLASRRSRLKMEGGLKYD